MANKRSTTVDKLPKGKLDDNAVVYKVMAALVLLCGGLMVLRSLRSYYATVGGMTMLDPLVPWMTIAGFGLCVLCVVVMAIWKNKLVRLVFPWLSAVFAMTGMTGLSMKLFWTQGFSALYFLWCAAMVAVVIFQLYGWDFFLFTLPTAAAGFLFLTFSTGFSWTLWNALVLGIVAVCLFITAFCAWNAAKHKGMFVLGKTRLLMSSSKYTPTLHYLVCGLWLVCIVAALLLGGLFSYYCMFAAIAVEFIAAVYYTFQLN